MRVSLKNSILLQLILLILAVILIPLLLLGSTSYNSYKNNIESKIISTNFNTLYQIDQNLSKVVDQINSIINTYNNNSLTETFLKESYSSDYHRLKRIAELETLLAEHLATLNWINCDIILLGKNGTIFTSNPNSPRLSSSNIHNSYWFKKASLDTSSIHWFIFERSYFSTDYPDERIVATKTLMNHTTQEIYGTLIIEINEQYFYEIYKDAVNEGEVLIIRNAEGNIVSTSDRTLNLSLDPSIAFFPVEEDSLMNPYHYEGIPCLYISQPSSVSDWTLIKLTPLTLMNAEIYKLQIQFFLIGLCCAGIILIGVIITCFRIYNPLRALSAKLESQLLHHPQKEISTHSPTFTDIVTGYEQLVEEVDETLDLLVTENEQRRKAELHALGMQINPHFLYNTLNSIKCLVWTKQYPLIEPTITALVKLLQQTLRHVDTFISLEEELNNVKNYIYIQNIRTCNSLTVNYNILPKYYTLKLPCLTLQPLVENAIFHGIEPLGKPGVITLSAYTKDNSFYIEILDNGVGILKEKLDSLLSQGSSPNKSGFNHIGLGNVNERLRLYYGDAYGLHIESKENIGTCITIKIKLSLEAPYECHDCR